MEADTVWALMVLGLPALGKVPTSWSGMPLAVSMRWVAEQLQLAVLVALTEALALYTLVLSVQRMPAVEVVDAVAVPVVPVPDVSVADALVSSPPPQAARLASRQALARCRHRPVRRCGGWPVVWRLAEPSAV